MSSKGSKELVLGVKPWLFWTVFSAMISIAIIAILISILLLIRPIVAPQSSATVFQPSGKRGFQEPPIPELPFFDTTKDHKIEVFHLGIEKDEILYYTVDGFDCQLSNFDSSCKNVITVTDADYSANPIHWRFEPFSVPGLSNIYSIRAVAGDAFRDQYLTITPTGGQGDCYLSGFGITCQNGILIQRQTWSNNINRQFFWQFTPFVFGGSTYFKIRGVLYNGNLTNLYLYSSGGGRDCQDAGYSDCRNVFVIDAKPFQQTPMFWKITEQ